MAKAKPTPKRKVAPMTNAELEALLSEGDDIDHVDLDEELALAEQPVVPRIRQNVAQVVQNPVAPAAAEIKKPSGFTVFEVLSEKDTDLRNVCMSLTMVIGLLRNMYSNLGDSIVEHAPFNQENLHELLEVIISDMKGEHVPHKNVIFLLRRSEWNAEQIIYYGILNLKDDSTQDVIEARCDEFKHQTSPYVELLTYLPVENVLQVLFARKMKKNAGVATADLVKQRKLPGTSFDTKLVKTKLAHWKGEPVPADVMTAGASPAAEAGAEGEVNFADLYSKNQTQPAMRMLRLLHKALNDPDQLESRYQKQFNGEKAQAVVSWLNDTLEQMGALPGLGYDLLIASEGTDTHGLLAQISENFGITDPQALMAKTEEILEKVSQQYPHFSPAPAPASAPAKPTFDYETFYDSLAQKPVALTHLFNALKGDNKEYDDHYRFTHFDGDSRIEVMESVDAILGDGMALTLRDATRLPDSNDRTTFIQIVAERFPAITNDPAKIQHVLRQIIAKLGAKYPKTLL